jgi:hypothetical protein
MHCSLQTRLMLTPSPSQCCFPIKPGGLASSGLTPSLAAAVGAPVTRAPLRPVLRGML